MTALIGARAGRKFAKLRRSLGCAAADRRGAVAIEFGFVVIPLVLLMMGIFQIGYSYYVAAGLDQASNAGRPSDHDGSGVHHGT